MIGRVTGWVGCALLVVASFSFLGQAAYGQNGYGLGFYNFNDGNGINYRQPPYYALFPPVYYSYVVPRTYGYSPFAYPPGVMTPDLIPVKPLVVNNPYVPSKPQAAPTSDRTASMGKMYYNPFVKQAGIASNAPQATRVE
jgi:hypothetical protein